MQEKSCMGLPGCLLLEWVTLKNCKKLSKIVKKFIISLVDGTLLEANPMKTKGKKSITNSYCFTYMDLTLM